MPSILSYFSDWRSLISRAIDSYRDVSLSLEDSREDHRRSAGYVDYDHVGRPGGYSFEIPLLWGSF